MSDPTITISAPEADSERPSMASENTTRTFGDTARNAGRRAARIAAVAGVAGGSALVLGTRRTWDGTRRIGSYLGKSGAQIAGASEQTIPAFKSSLLPMAAGIAGVVMVGMTNSYGPNDTIIQGALEGALAFGLPAGAVSLVRNIVAKPSIGRVFRNFIVGGLALGGTVLGVGAGLRVGALPDDSPMIHKGYAALGIPYPRFHDDPNAPTGILSPGPVKAIHDGYAFKGPGLHKDSKAVGHFTTGQEFCATVAIVGDAPILQLKDKTYVSNAPGSFVADPSSSACKDSATPVKLEPVPTLPKPKKPVGKPMKLTP